MAPPVWNTAFNHLYITVRAINWVVHSSSGLFDLALLLGRWKLNDILMDLGNEQKRHPRTRVSQVPDDLTIIGLFTQQIR